MNHGETYWAGVRRRLKSALIIGSGALATIAISWAALAVSGSVPLMLAVAIVSGALGGALDLRLDPLPTSDPEPPHERAIWFVLMGPAILGLVAVTFYSAFNPPDGPQLFGAGGVAGLLGFGLAMTARMMRSRKTS